jgi:endonuclease YncB( thermonuclease family)
VLKFVLRMLFRGVSTQRKITPSPRPAHVRRAPDGLRKPVGQSSAIEPDQPALTPLPATILGKCRVIDGDTIQIKKVRIRLAGIDAPELDHWWGKKAKWELVALCKGQTITARIEPDISYDRAVATCFLPDGRDLSAEMVKKGLALDWPKFSDGKYASYEPDGVRKKLFGAAARQKGHMHVFEKARVVRHVEVSVCATATTASPAISCPRCGESMLQRTNKKNGQKFWGCAKFPKCRGTRKIPVS